MRRATLAPADALVDEMLGRIVADRALVAGAEVALLVNGLGGTPATEPSSVAASALRWLAARGITVSRAWAGSFLTALDMTGCSLSLLALDSERRSLPDEAASAPAWPGGAGAVRPVQPRATKQAAPPPSGRPGPLEPARRRWSRPWRRPLRRAPRRRGHCARPRTAPRARRR